jgi:hypothetical protein
VTKHTALCERMEAAIENLEDRGVEFRTYQDAVVQREVTSQNESGYPCTCK